MLRLFLDNLFFRTLRVYKVFPDLQYKASNIVRPAFIEYKGRIIHIINVMNTVLPDNPILRVLFM